MNAWSSLEESRADGAWVDRDPVSVAVVGAGYWGPNLVRALHDLPQARVSAVCDRDPEALAKIRRRWASVRCRTSFDDVLSDDSIEAVALATPVGTHAELAAAALRAGKHVFVEKPLTATSLEAERLIDLATSRRLVLMPGHTFLYSPAVIHVASLIEQGELGDIAFISMSRLNLGLHQSDNSVLWDLAPHDLSILLYWLGEMPQSVSAVGRECLIPGTPDVAFAHMRFDSGAIANVEVAWLAPTKLRRVVVVGSRKMVVYDDTSSEPVRVYDSGASLNDPMTFGEYQLSYRTGDIVTPMLPAVEPLSLELADFCSAVRHGTHPRSDAALGRDVVRIVERLDASRRSSGGLVPIDLELREHREVA